MSSQKKLFRRIHESDLNGTVQELTKRLSFIEQEAHNEGWRDISISGEYDYPDRRDMNPWLDSEPERVFELWVYGIPPAEK